MACPALAATRLELAHVPFAPTVQSERETALLRPLDMTARACPFAWVLQPAPAHCAATWVASFAANALVTAPHPPTPAQVAMDFALTFFPATALAVLEVRVAQPASVPLSQSAPTDALVMA
jgi:hypothetical protein